MGSPGISFTRAVSQGIIQSDLLATKFKGIKGMDLVATGLANLRVQDLQDAVQSINYDYLPYDVPQDIVERILYYRGTGCLFYLKANDSFYFLPYVSKGLDAYGRPRKVTPVEWNGKATIDEKGKFKEFIMGLELTPVYDVIPRDKWTPEMMEDCCVLFYDYTPQAGIQNIISRAQLNEPLLKTMAELVPFCRTTLANSTGVSGMRINDESERGSVLLANDATVKAAIEGERYIPIVGQVDFQQLNTATVGSANDFLLTYQALDNMRKTTHGLSANGTYQKAAHMLQTEQDANATGADLIMADRIYQRQKAVMTADTLWPLAMNVNVSDIVTGIDANLDGDYENYDNEADNPSDDVMGDKEVNEDVQ